MEDTDSMAMVATDRGEKVACPGSHKRRSLRGEIRALSWQQVKEISQRFAALNPYDRRAVAGSILKIEDDNRDPVAKQQRQLYCLAISAKRYALLVKEVSGVPALLREGANNKQDRWSEHGLGHLLNPMDLQSEDREWIWQTWLNMIRRTVGLQTEPSSFERLPAVGRISISSPAVIQPLETLNKGKKYCDQIKPFNFLLACHVQKLGHPTGADPEQFHLIAPYELNPKKWLKKDWIDQYTGERYRISTAGHHGTSRTARVKTYGEVLREYEFHAEAKCADHSGSACVKQTIGLLQRRHVQVARIKYIGKESNNLEDVEAGLVHSPQNVYTEYIDPRRDEWQTVVLPALKKASLSTLQKESGFSRRMLMKARAGTTRPHRKNRERLAAILKELGLV